MKQWTFGKQIGMGMILLFASGVLAAVFRFPLYGVPTVFSLK